MDVSEIFDNLTLRTLLSVHDLGPGPVSFDKLEKFRTPKEKTANEPMPYLFLLADGYVTIDGNTAAITPKGEDAVRRMREELIRVMNQNR